MLAASPLEITFVKSNIYVLPPLHMERACPDNYREGLEGVRNPNFIIFSSLNSIFLTP